MRKLFRDLKVGDSVYWAYYRSHYMVNVLVEEYRILDIKHKEGDDLEFKLTHDFYLIVHSTDTRIRRTDKSFFVADKEGIDGAVRDIKETIMREYQKQIISITEEMCEIMKAPYQLYDKT